MPTKGAVYSGTFPLVKGEYKEHHAVKKGHTVLLSFLSSSSLFRQVSYNGYGILWVEVTAMFHDRIRELRENFGMSQKQVARELNLSTSAIGMYEQGRRTPSLELVVAYADLFSVTTDFLLRGDEFVGKYLSYDK